LTENGGMHCRGAQLFCASIEAGGHCKDIGANPGGCCWLQDTINKSGCHQF